jgi:hypothetical protein
LGTREDLPATKDLLGVVKNIDRTEHPLMKSYRRDVLNKLHADRCIEYDRESEMITLSPTGAQEVEEKILRKVKTRA